MGNNYFDNILNKANKLEKDGKEKPENDDPILTAYLLQLRAANWFSNNPGSVLLSSSKYSGLKNEAGNQEPLGGPINFELQNYRNRQGSKFCSDEYPFWDVPNKKSKKVKIQEDKTKEKSKEEPKEEPKEEIKETKEESKEKSKEESKEKSKEETKVLNTKETFTNKPLSGLSIAAIITFVIFLVSFLYLIYSE